MHLYGRIGVLALLILVMGAVWTATGVRPVDPAADTSATQPGVSSQPAPPPPSLDAGTILPTLPVNETFDFPVRPPDGNGASIATFFGRDNHLGEDWNTAPGDKDEGEPVYSCGDGVVLSAEDYGNYMGMVVRIVYRLPAGSTPEYVEMLYGTMQRATVSGGGIVRKGQKIGEMGTGWGSSHAHLHWEVRERIGLGLGYSAETTDGWLDPRQFVLDHSGAGGSGGGAPRTCGAKELSADEADEWGASP